ncbi:MAG TPA: cytidylate kinase family protein [Candidatus Saccharimonadales bacterium]|nr:cytidylate kinase family protein [Candidatus Saccharimonadales bacterium]
MTAPKRHITISGELGSGKSTVADRLARMYGHRLVSAGNINRAIAADRNLSEVDLNLLAETDQSIDAQVDSETRRLATDGHPAVFDGHIAWRIVDDAFKVHLLIDPDVAAGRLYASRASAVEHYGSVDEAKAALEKRYASERRRYRARFGVDEARLENYDLVIDTSDATVEQIIDAIRLVYEGEAREELIIMASPRRLLPGYDVVSDRRSSQWNIPHPEVAYCRPYMCFCNGHLRIAKAIESEDPFIDVRLRAEDNGELEPGVSAKDCLGHISPEWVESWSQKYSLDLRTP